MSKPRAKWKRRRSAIGAAVGDPVAWDYIEGETVLATVKQTAHGFGVSMPSGETAGPFGDVALAKQSAVKRIKREKEGRSPWTAP